MKNSLVLIFLFLPRTALLAFVLLVSLSLNALPADSTRKFLSVADFIGIIKKYHPIAKQANLIPEEAKAQLLIARGEWDPKINSSYDRKSYDGSNYYSYFENKVSVPIWYGIELSSGYDMVYGDQINDETKLPKDGLGYIGISIPLLKNMLMDRQRAALRKSQIFREASEQQRLVMLNDLLFDALKTYYDWSYAYNQYLIYAEATEVARIRFNATVQSTLQGDRAAIDTIEALTQLQSRLFQLNDARLTLINSQLELSNFLWLENDVPAVPDTNIIPAPLNSDFVQQLIQLTRIEEMEMQLSQSHPLLLNYQFKLKQLNIERRLKIENLKPALNVRYNVLSERFNFQSNAGLVLTNNYKFGLNFAMPLSFMQGRGDLKLTQLEIKTTRYELEYKKQQLVNKLKSYFNELINLQQQTKLYEETVSGFRALFTGESTRFLNGESSLFLVNARENRYLESQVKLRELQAKYFKTEIALKWALGNISTL